MLPEFRQRKAAVFPLGQNLQRDERTQQAAQGPGMAAGCLGQRFCRHGLLGQVVGQAQARR
jgi:hypothetical protein